MNSFDRGLLYAYRSPYRLKRTAIKNSIFACDIEPSATDITKLRLWLSLVIDDQIMEQRDDERGYDTKPRELPNLDCNIICGNSLMDEFGGIPLLAENATLKNESVNRQLGVLDSEMSVQIQKLIDLQSKLYDEKDHVEKDILKDEIQNVYDKIILEQIRLKGNTELVDEYFKTVNQPSKPFILWQLYFPKVFRDNDGFDIVIGNPPYIDSEEMTRSMPEFREIYSKKYECAKGNWDFFILFIEKGLKLLNNRGVISMIIPNKLIAAPYAETLRKYMSHYSMKVIRDYSEVRVFKSAAVYPVVFVEEKNANKKQDDCLVEMEVMDDMIHVHSHVDVAISTFYSNTNWDKFFHSTKKDLDIVYKMLQFPELNSIAKVNGAATVNEAYLVKNFIYDGSEADLDTLKFINTGGIDPFISLHGVSPIRYLKDSYQYPLVHKDDLKKMSSKRYNESICSKIIIGGMTKILECYFDNGNYLAGKSTTIVYGHEHLKYITAVLNSKLMSYFYRIYFNSMTLSGGFFRIGAPQIKKLPIAITNDEKMIYTIETLVENIENKYDNNIKSKIDKYIYTVYGLSDEEIDLVENTTKG